MKSIAGEHLLTTSISGEKRNHGRDLLIESAGGGDWNGLFRLGVFHESGEYGFERNEQVSEKLFEKSAAAGFSEALVMKKSVNRNEFNAFFGICDLDSL